MYIFLIQTLLILSLSVYQVGAAYIYRRQSPDLGSQCRPFYTTFPPTSVSRNTYSAPFVAISPAGSYQTTPGGLELYLNKPEGTIKTKQGANDKTSEGATVNSTFAIHYGKVTFEVSAPAIPGVVTAAILIADERDEIDVELLGGDPAHWQTNIFAPTRRDKEPLFGVFSSIERVPHPNPSIAKIHSYTIDWNKERIEWGIDGRTVRTLKKEESMKGGVLHYPSHPSRLQLGIWDASSPSGTSEWAKGPINWSDAPRSMKAVVRSVRVECPKY
ncbi:putative glycosidase crf1 [Hypsizygus marmoreus]|uniref:Glycosidase crf1 n=1 Tax=Hypsizygus marmoreus TaxID=39966 RepID=A0A369JYE4_HYPMA|nr:putative glycosidase crf1 [Hypsizygus marmoreus]